MRKIKSILDYTYYCSVCQSYRAPILSSSYKPLTSSFSLLYLPFIATYWPLNEGIMPLLSLVHASDQTPSPPRRRASLLLAGHTLLVHVAPSRGYPSALHRLGVSRGVSSQLTYSGHGG